MALKRPAEDRQERPSIIVERRPDDMIEQAYLTALENNEHAPVYRMGRNLVTIRHDADRLAYLDLLDRDGMVSLMSRVAEAKKVTPKGKLEDCPVPVRIAAMLLKSEHAFFPIQAVSRVPVLSQHGTFNLTPGYDPCTQVYYNPISTFALPNIKDKPSKDDAVRAAKVIQDELLCDFPFLTPADRANAYAFGLTLFCRHAIDGRVPMAVSDAVSRKGTGKGLLINTFHTIATGSEAMMRGMPETKDELRKAFLTSLMKGETSFILDNVRGTIVNDHLESMITAPIWADRILGANKEYSGPIRITWAMAGNGIQLGGDMPRRAYFITQDAGVAHAYARRKFTHADRSDADSLIAYIKRHQGRYVAAMMTIIRAWYAADAPKWSGSSPLDGSFGLWTRMIGGILEYAGIDAFLGNVEDDMGRTDVEDMQWAMFLHALHNKFQDNPFTAGEIVLAFLTNGSPDAANVPEEILLAVSPIFDPAARAAKLSRFLRPRIDSRFGDGIRLVRHESRDRSSAVRYRIDAPTPVYFPCPRCNTAVPDSGVTLSGKVTVAQCPGCHLVFSPDNTQSLREDYRK